MPHRILIRAPVAADSARFIAAARASRRLHGRWVHPPTTPARFRQYLVKMALPQNFPFLVCRRDTGAMVGVFNVTNAVMGPFRSAYLGYYAFAGHERQGLMRQGLRAVVRHAFRTIKLHRLEANIQPGNTASIALVRSAGFALEGFSPRYVKIAGRWRDHERWAIRSD